MELEVEDRIDENIVLDMKAINLSLEKDRIYTKDGVIFKYDLKSDEDVKNVKDEHKYVVQISNGKFTYIGALNSEIQRSMMGKNVYSNGDVYLGFWNNNKKHKYGIYVHKPEEGQVEVYHGSWEEGVKNNEGIYIWKKGENFDEKEASNASLDAYIGQFHQGQFSQGLFVSQKVEEERVMQHFYFGSFNAEGKKMDEQGFYFMAHLGKVFLGKIHDDKLLEGHVAKVKEDGSIDTPFYFKKDEAGVVDSQDISEEVKEEITSKLQQFIDLTRENDFFQLIHNEGKICLREIAHYDSLEKFENEEEFAKDLNTLLSYSDICSKIKHFIKSREEEAKEIEEEANA